MEQLDILISLTVASLGGMAVGIEREWSARADGKKSLFAGVRTFLLIGLLGALGVVFIRTDLAPMGIIILTATAAMVGIAYAISARSGNLDSTTEFAAILVLAAGALAGTGRLALASGINAFTALILAEKSGIHAMVFRLRTEELHAGIRFAVLALVVLPMLPEGPYGPYPGVRPRELWALVLLFSGISFAGFIARRVVGSEKGYTIAGFLGGIISSTLVTLNFSQESKSRTDAAQALSTGVLAACTVMFARALLLIFVLNWSIGLRSIPYFLIPFLVGIGILLLSRKKKTENAEAKHPDNPLRLFTAIKMVLAFQAALYLMEWVSKSFGSTGILVTSFLVGLTDVDTLTFMIGKQKALPVDLAALALAMGALSNTLLKLGIAGVLGSGNFRRPTVFGLAVLAGCVLVLMLALR